MLDALLPARCVACDRRLRTTRARPETPFCPPCEAGLPWWRAVDGCPRCGDADLEPEERGSSGTQACPRCLASGSPLHRCTSLLRYAGPVVRWIPGFKREGRAFGPPAEPTRVMACLSRRLGARLAELGAPVDLLMPVPVHPRRLLRRGFDPALSISDHLARATGLPVDTRRLLRLRSTPPQASLAGEARRQNVRNAFGVCGRLPHDLRVGLVDDVLTTGSTLEAAANALLEAGAWEVHAFTLAATLPPAARRPRPGLPRRAPDRTPDDRRGPSDPPMLPPPRPPRRAPTPSSTPPEPPIQRDRRPPDGGPRSLR